MKQPYLVRRADGALLAMAGLWDRWTSGDGEVIDSFAIITKPAEPPVNDLHDRMPAILAEPHHDVWLDPTRTDAKPLIALLAEPSPRLASRSCQ